MRESVSLSPLYRARLYGDGMIYQLAQLVKSELAAQGCPYSVVYGPERAPYSLSTPRIVIERDRTSSETIAAPRARMANPVNVATRIIACKARVFAQSTLGGATVGNHEAEADLVVDKLICAIFKCVRIQKKLFEFGQGKLLGADELKYSGLEAWPGVVYELEFTVDRGVFQTTWTQAAKAEATLGGEDGVVFGTTISAGGVLPGTALPHVTTEISNG